MKRIMFMTIQSLLASLIIVLSSYIKAEAIISQEVTLPTSIQLSAAELFDKEEIEICPTLLLSIVYEESKGNVEVVNKKFKQGSPYRGICQCNTYYFRDYLNELGIKAEDIDDPYNAMWLCAYYLEDMFEKYGDEPYLVVMCWAMGEDNAVRSWNQGYVLPYAKRVVDRSAEWEPVWYEKENYR